jgi:hypothetical protein
MQENEELKELLEREQEKNEKLQAKILEVELRRETDLKELQKQFYVQMYQRDKIIEQLKSNSSSRMVFFS